MLNVLRSGTQVVTTVLTPCHIPVKDRHNTNHRPSLSEASYRSPQPVAPARWVKAPCCARWTCRRKAGGNKPGGKGPACPSIPKRGPRHAVLLRRRLGALAERSAARRGARRRGAWRGRAAGGRAGQPRRVHRHQEAERAAKAALGGLRDALEHQAPAPARLRRGGAEPARSASNTRTCRETPAAGAPPGRPWPPGASARAAAASAYQARQSLLAPWRAMTPAPHAPSVRTGSIEASGRQSRAT